MTRIPDWRVQRAVEKRAVRVNSRRRHPRHAHRVAVAASDSGIFIVHRPARVRAVRQAVAPRRVIDFNDGTGILLAHGPAHLKPAFSIVDKSYETLTDIAYILAHGEDQSHDVGSGRVLEPSDVIDSRAFDVNVPQYKRVEGQVGTHSPSLCRIVEQRQPRLARTNGRGNVVDRG